VFPDVCRQAAHSFASIKKQKPLQHEQIELLKVLLGGVSTAG
jgi:hypothetical protein